MIHIIRFAGELNVFHYCHSSEEVGGEGRRGCRRRPPALLSRSPTLSPPARESRDARSLRLTHSVAVRVCVPSVIRDRSRSSCESRAVLLKRVHPRILRLGRSSTAHPVEHAGADGSADRAPAACERTVSAVDHCMHALDITLRVYFESLAKRLPMDRCTRLVDHHRDGCQRLTISPGIASIFHVSSPAVLINSVGLLRR